MGQMLQFAAPDSLVVIVDDDPSVRDALSLLLNIEGFSTRSFGDGDSFLEAVPGLTPACVILDLQLPGRSGLDVLKHLVVGRFAAPVLSSPDTQTSRPQSKP